MKTTALHKVLEDIVYSGCKIDIGMAERELVNIERSIPMLTIKEISMWDDEMAPCAIG
jgi:hypothetical protein